MVTIYYFYDLYHIFDKNVKRILAMLKLEHHDPAHKFVHHIEQYTDIGMLPS